MRKVLLFLSAILFLQTSYSQKTWTGNASDNDWFTASNWSPVGVPTENDIVTINDPEAYIEINPPFPTDTAFAKVLILESIAKLALHADRILYIDTKGNENVSMIISGGVFSVCGSLFLMGAITDGLHLNDSTVVSVGPMGVLNIVDFANFANGQGIQINEENSIFNNDGHTIIRCSSTRSTDGIVNHGNMINGGLLEIRDIRGNSNYYGIENYHLLQNNGELVIDSVAGASAILASSSIAEVINFGSITITNVLNVNKPEISITNGATLKGAGTINCELLNIAQAGSSLSPSLSESPMTINADLFLGINASYQLDLHGIAGPSMLDGHQQVILNGNLTLEDNATDGPTFRVVLKLGFVPTDIDNFTFLDYNGTKDGDFSAFIVQPASQDDWGVFELGHELIYRKPCATANALVSCTEPSCPLWTGIVSGDETIQMNGAFEIQSGETFNIQFPETELSGGFTVEPGTTFSIIPSNCTF